MMTSFKLTWLLLNCKVLRLMPRDPAFNLKMSKSKGFNHSGAHGSENWCCQPQPVPVTQTLCPFVPWPSPLSRDCTMAGCSTALNSGMV